MPWFVNRTGAKWALVIAGTIMSVRIAGSAMQLGPVWIAAVKMLPRHRKTADSGSPCLNSSLPISTTSYCPRSTCWCCSSPLSRPAVYSPIAGYLYDTIGFADTYLILGAIAGFFTLVSVFTLRDFARG
ncbi:Lactose-proton symport [Kluyvera cryocrescens]|uniref:Lactose-proton symport n=1 Tax=Kluyvera cryocrescens TaxID=580 RepID=A0A485D4C2_KLUCR|nr:Lactose-proton symport [Kluyvera cryocrescens]